MKKGIKNTLLITSFFTLGGFTSASYQIKNNTAEVTQNEGISVFAHSVPVKEYKKLGYVDMPEVVWSSKAGDMVNVAIKRLKKQYPAANGIIFTSDNFTEADAILIE